MKITIPHNDDEAREVAVVATLNRWALAGYIASQVTLDNKPGPNSGNIPRTSPSVFASRGLRGLSDPKTVRLYAERWRDQFGAPPEPGAHVTIPDDLEWPPTSTDRVGWGVQDEDRREAIRAQADADGTGPAKAVDIAANPKAMAAAIKADPQTAEAAREALATHDIERFKERTREAGGNADLPDTGPGDAIAVELAFIEAKIRSLLGDAERLLLRAEPDEQPRYRAMFDGTAQRLATLVSGGVPDTIEGLI